MSKCLHDYQFVREGENGIIEKCKLCKKRNVVRKGNLGRINHKTYREEHRRDLLQPVGKTAKEFEKVYGEFDGGKVRKQHAD